MNHQRTIRRQRERRKFRVRKRLTGTTERPRLSVFRSHKHLYVQLIDDRQGRTLLAASTLDPALREQVGYGGNRQAAEVVGRTVAERAIAQGINRVCFDRGAFKYHGRVAAVADAARQAGLEL